MNGFSVQLFAENVFDIHHYIERTVRFYARNALNFVNSVRHIIAPFRKLRNHSAKLLLRTVKRLYCGNLRDCVGVGRRVALHV